MNSLPFSYTVHRSRRKTICIRITPDGRVEVRCPQRMKAVDIQRFVTEKASWVEKHLAAKAALPQAEKFTPEQIQLLAMRAKGALPPRVEHYAKQMGLSYGRITIRSQHSRWGSCSGKGNLNFNCLLMLTPLEVWDYVIVHELCHLRQMNHSPAFWAEVEAVLPDYRQQKKWLKENGSALIARLP